MTKPVEARTRITDPKVMRALAHPARLAILEEMAGGRDGTATQFAAVCGLSPSATSYHLRALAKVGLVEEAPGRGDGRERVWRRVGAGRYELDTGPDTDPEARRAEHDLLLVYLAREEARVREWLARSHEDTREWARASTLSHGIHLLTADELTALSEQIAALIEPYSRNRRTDPPPDARAVVVQYRAFPLPE